MAARSRMREACKSCPTSPYFGRHWELLNPNTEDLLFPSAVPYRYRQRKCDVDKGGEGKRKGKRSAKVLLVAAQGRLQKH